MALGLPANAQQPDVIVNQLILGEYRVQPTGDLTLTEEQANNNRLRFDPGSVSGAFTVTVPNQSKHYTVHNLTGQNCIVSGGTGSNVTVPTGVAYRVFCDGEGNIVRET